MTKRVPTSSVSQVNNFRSCQRKWFFSSVDYLPQEPRRATALGDCFHQVAERYLDVDEHGLKDGKAPDLYPEGWHIQKDYFGNKVLFILDHNEQSTIKRLIEKAIDDGVLIRRPGAEVEYNEKILITPEISFQVRIDYAYDWTIEDHKTCKNFRYTTRSDKNHDRYIGRDLQLKVYAYFWALKRHKETGEPIPKYLTIRHNQFCVGPETPRMETPSTQVTFAECKECFEDLKIDVLKQLELRKGAAKGEIKWVDMEKNIETCGAYGGCPYKAVCTSQETPDMHKRRINRTIEQLTLSIKKEPEMGFNLAGNGATPAQQEVVKELENGPAEESTLELLLKEKAAIEEQCKGLGVDPNLTPKYPEILKSIENLESVEDKKKEEADKKAAAEAKNKKATEAKAKKEEQEEIVKEEVVKEEVVKEEVKKTDTKESESEDLPDFSISRPKANRSKEIFVYINCAPIGSPSVPLLTIQEIFAKKSAQMAHDQGVSSFYDLDAWKRREGFARAIPQIIKELEGMHITSYACGPDEQALLNAIMTQSVRVIAAR